MFENIEIILNIKHICRNVLLRLENAFAYAFKKNHNHYRFNESLMEG
jgi:hypothetical protein